MIFVYTLTLILISAPFLPWWTIPVLAGCVSFWRLRRLWRALPQAFLAGSLGWILPALWMDAQNGSLLSAKIAALFHLPGSLGILAATGIISGLLASLGAMMGQRLRKTFLVLREP